MIGQTWLGMTLLPRAAARPRLLGWWLIRAHGAQIASLISVILLMTVLPPIFERLSEAIHPNQRLLGLVEIPGSRRAEIEHTIGVLQLAAGSILAMITAWLAVLRLPDAVAEARRESARRERAADSLRGAERIGSRQLYREALGLAIDPEREASLRSKLATLWSDATVRLAADARPVMPPHERPPERYLLRETIGQGGMGQVFLATDSLLGRDVALKELSAAGDADSLSRFRAEAQALARLVHPNIVQVYDLIESGDRLWISMELVRGRDLASIIEQAGALSIEKAAALLRPIAEALGHAHDCDVVHRDVKPANIIVGADGIPKLADFGLARVRGAERHTRSGIVIGSPGYLSPEQASGDPGEAPSDVYGLGVAIFESLTGGVPFSGETGAVLTSHLREPPPRLSSILPEIPPDLDDLVAAMLDKTPENRPALAEVVRVLSNHEKATTP